MYSLVIYAYKYNCIINLNLYAIIIDSCQAFKGSDSNTYLVKSHMHAYMHVPEITFEKRNGWFF